MPRVNLKAVGQYIHTFSRRVAVTDLNYLAQLDHSSIVKIAHEARVDFFHKYGISERNIVVGDLICQYQSTGELFDDLQIDTALGDPNRCGFRLYHQIRARVPLGPDRRVHHSPLEAFDNPSHATGSFFKPIALLETGLVTLDAITKKPIEIPPEFFANIGVFYKAKSDNTIPLLLPHSMQVSNDQP